MREGDRDPQNLRDTEAGRKTSSGTKILGYAVIGILVLMIILLATGAIKFGPY